MPKQVKLSHSNSYYVVFEKDEEFIEPLDIYCPVLRETFQNDPNTQGHCQYYFDVKYSSHISDNLDQIGWALSTRGKTWAKNGFFKFREEARVLETLGYVNIGWLQGASIPTLCRKLSGTKDSLQEHYEANKNNCVLTGFMQGDDDIRTYVFEKSTEVDK